ncbi:hypothetical protein ACE11G_06115 [Gordonia sp. PS3]|uniref:Uncharacterized protein n=1 Tax=Gordonia neofelifaecis NRRL B-59395 TaxID=644548 RepID=F1YDZ8_9ACTN|nr:hypothetical protein [Gordonia neofelifaecis]EGD57088.1 hypothetical protein SCNU_01900 [Gordonia neofelifaecis NRRL B-59395]
MNTAALALLGHASALLSGGVTVESGNSARLAAFLARQAAEILIDQRCEELGAPCPNGTMRSKISILKSLDRHGPGTNLIYAWHRLSECCHHHSYELPPTVSEVRALCAALV